jgi:hypothetical protein
MIDDGYPIWADPGSKLSSGIVEVRFLTQNGPADAVAVCPLLGVTTEVNFSLRLVPAAAGASAA